MPDTGSGDSMSMKEPVYRIEFYVPETHLEQVKAAVFNAGAGRLGEYTECAWQTSGTGQFRPGEASSPYLGAKGAVETVNEYKVELVCEKRHLTASIAAMKQAHPYEEPAYAVFSLEPY